MPGSTPNTPASAQFGVTPSAAFGKHAAIAGAFSRQITESLAFEAVDCRRHQHLLLQHTGVVDLVARAQPVAAIDDQIVGIDEIHHVSCGHFGVMRPHLDQRIEGPEARSGGSDLGHADIGLCVQHLALQVPDVDGVEIDDAERADTGRRQVERRWRTQSAAADDQHTCGLQFLLAGLTELT